MPNTDPRLGGGGPVDHLRVTTTELLAAGALDAEGAQGLSDRLRAPLLPSVKPIAN
jgi:hypothetical protein